MQLRRVHKYRRSWRYDLVSEDVSAIVWEMRQPRGDELSYASLKDRKLNLMGQRGICHQKSWKCDEDRGGRRGRASPETINVDSGGNKCFWKETRKRIARVMAADGYVIECDGRINEE